MPTCEHCCLAAIRMRERLTQIDAPQFTSRCTAWLARTMPPAAALREIRCLGALEPICDFSQDTRERAERAQDESENALLVLNEPAPNQRKRGSQPAT